MVKEELRFDLESMPLGRLVSVAGMMAGEHWRRTMEKHGLGTGAEVTVLFALSHSDQDLSHREVAKLSWLSPASITPIVDRLVEDNLVERIRDVEDRRVVRLRITEYGRIRVGTAGKVIAEEFGSLFPRLEPDEEAIVRRYLASLVRNLGGEWGSSR
jgi:DNA-binding MarR family transcriptional regulator